MKNELSLNVLNVLSANVFKECLKIVIAFCDGKLYVHVVGDLVLFTAAKEVDKSVKISQSYSVNFMVTFFLFLFCN